MNDDLREFLCLLNQNDVHYLVIGAHALAYYGLPRFTEDFDVWVGSSPDNAQRLARALEEFGLPLPPGGEQAWQTERKMIRLGVPPNRIDILNFAAQLPFEEAWQRRVRADISGVSVPMISREDFIRSKRDAGRPKDLRDLEALGES